jgi:hypothetical protein
MLLISFEGTGCLDSSYSRDSCTRNVNFKSLKSIIFWDMTPCSPLSFNWRLGGTYRFHFQGRRNKFRKKKNNSKQAGGKQRRYVSETSVETQRITRRHTPEDDIFHNHRCENLKSHIWKFGLVTVQSGDKGLS